VTEIGPRSHMLDRRGFPRFWDEERETRAPKERDALILTQLQNQLRYVYSELPFYRRHYDAHDFRPDEVKTLADFTAKVPVITKKMLVVDQAANPVFGTYTPAAGRQEIARIHGSSGTSGVPTLYAVSRTDWKRSGEVHAMAQWCAGIRPDDLMQISFPFGLFFGGWGVIQGAERIGATVFPIGPIDSEKQVEFIQRLKPTVFSATPSYCIHLLSVAARMGVDLRESSVRTLFVGGEPGGSLPGTSKAIAEGWGTVPRDAGSTSEMYPFQTSTACEAGMGTHLFTDETFAEIVDKDDSNTPVPEEERGEIVYTHLWRDSQPMIRFASGDETFLSTDACSCGRTYPRLPHGVLGRLDDMLVIRGANIFPSAIETGLRSIGGFGPEFRIVVDKKGALDELLVEAEMSGESLAAGVGLPEAELRDRRNALAARAEAVLKKLTSIRVPVTVLDPGVLPPTTFKAKRVLDLRNPH